tara:strand:- start:1148 stop:1483 length:336 start_codon:yes stop_codon:yes gene_type:complete
MTNSPEAVTLYVPLMKDLHMAWEEIKRTPRMELEGILAAYYEFNLLHSMDGYEAKDISDMAKHRPSVRQDWNRYMAQKRKYERLSAPQDLDTTSESRVKDAVSELKSKISS